jgi:hypothetical protein
MADPVWTFEEMPTWHWPMLSAPKRLAEILHAASVA